MTRISTGPGNPTFRSTLPSLMSALFFTAAATVSHAQTWNIVGNDCFSDTTALYTSIALDSSGTPYVLYSDFNHNEKATVMKYNGGAWTAVGASGFSAGQVGYSSIAIDPSGTPYVAYEDWGYSGNAAVLKFNGTDWENVGSPGFSGNYAVNTNIAFDGTGTPYIVYTNDNTTPPGLASVNKFNGAGWVSVGATGFSAALAEFTTIAIDGSGTPYVAYSDYANGRKATVMKFNGTDWTVVGSAGFSASEANYTSIVVDGNGTPYVAYQDTLNNWKATVMKFNGTDWTPVGNAGFSDGRVQSTKLAIDEAGVLYVVFGDSIYSGKTTLMKFNGTNWVTVCNPGFSPGTALYTSLAVTKGGTPFVAFEDLGESLHNGSVTVMTPGEWAKVNNAPNPVAASLKVFPNPAASQCTVTLSSPVNESALLTISNVLGEIVRQISISTNTATSVQLYMPAGVYLLTGITNGEKITAKIVVE